MIKIYVCFLRENSSKSQHETAHKLLSFALKREYGIENFSLGKKSHGKPFLEGHENIKINLSHCKRLAVCAVGDSVMGIDCESIRSVRLGVIRRVCTEAEKSEIEAAENPDLMFTRFWTLKEAFVKAVGRGISYPMKNAAFSLEDNVIYTNIKSAKFTQWVLQNNYIISLCTAGSECTASLKFVLEDDL